MARVLFPVITALCLGTRLCLSMTSRCHVLDPHINPWRTRFCSQGCLVVPNGSHPFPTHPSCSPRFPNWVPMVSSCSPMFRIRVCYRVQCTFHQFQARAWKYRALGFKAPTLEHSCAHFHILIYRTMGSMHMVDYDDSCGTYTNDGEIRGVGRGDFTSRKHGKKKL